jgi:hypothetical protein
MTDWIIIALLLAGLVIYVFDLRPKRSDVDAMPFEDLLEDLVAEIREIPGDFIEKLKQSKLLEGLKSVAEKVESPPEVVAKKEESPAKQEEEKPPKKLTDKETRDLARKQKSSAKLKLPENKLAELKKGFAEAKKNANGQNVGLTFKVMKTKTSEFEEITLRGVKEIEKFIKEADDKGYIVQ